MSRSYLTFSFVQVVVALALLSACTNQPETPPQTAPEVAPVTGPYLAMQAATEPTALAPDLLSSPLTQYNGTFSPAGDLFFFTAEYGNDGAICMTHLQENNEWSTPVIAAFSGKWSDYDPLFSPDGSKLYFSSERPANLGEDNTGTHIWVVERQDNGWGEPTVIDLTKRGDYHSSITNSGDIYFNVWWNGHIYKASPTNSIWAL